MTSFERLLRDIVPPLMRRWRVPGVAVGLSYRGQRTLCGFGAGPGGGVAADADAVFGIGSVADTFLAALVASLAEQGRLGLDDPAAGLLPAVHGTFIGLDRGDGGQVTGLRIAGRLAPRVGLLPVS